MTQSVRATDSILAQVMTLGSRKLPPSQVPCWVWRLLDILSPPLPLPLIKKTRKKNEDEKIKHFTTSHSVYPR